jgi:outer membrane protein OmpA-like peptidoglycan-associated protein
MVVKGKLIRFVIESPDGKIIPGAVHHVDYGRGRDIATFESGRYLDILPPNSANNPMTIVCALFGYKEVVHEIDYNKPGDTPGVLRDEHNAWVIPYKLEPLVTGDVSVMYRVAFYKDAVVMLPAAQSELDQLVYMMNANPNYRIKIHGHCNGNNARRIIALGSSKNYFATTGSDERKGSAKDLSRMRAEAVQMYLADHGIDIGRTEIYAWGGLNMLVSETSTSAKLNDRIEIEIMKN